MFTNRVRLWQKVFPLVFALFVISCIPSRAADQPGKRASDNRPNVILIMADDFGYELVGANGGTSYKTPALDRLAATGTRFTHCYSQPLCTPTRVQLMTGIYNVRNYVQFGLLDKVQTTFAHLFKKAGYPTCITGKWQLGQDFSLPAHFGFDEYCLWQLTRIPPRYRNPGLEINGKQIDYTSGEYGPDLVNDYALEYIQRKKDEPFFLYYPLMLTHSPYEATPESADWPVGDKAGGDKQGGRAKGKRAGDGSQRQHFGDMVEYADRLMGKLVARLDELGLRERTLILFTGDNGTGSGMHSMMGEVDVPGGKGSTHDGGMHVPLIVNMPGKVTAGRVARDLVDSTDFLPTICEAAKIEVPSSLAIDGHSFWRQACGETGQPREWIYCWYSRNGVSKDTREFARNHDFKLYRDGRLFDVSQGDRDEKPVSAESATSAATAARQKLQAVLDKYERSRPQRLIKLGKLKPDGNS